ncbi:MAG: hypothetical protein HQL53_09405, partial [Magnetococcales bacterium]|nr:hypothetical protein [Magnetococcales bacterium]
MAASIKPIADVPKPPKSDALRANLLETTVDKVDIPADHQLLLTVVERYAGIRKGLINLLLEMNHPYRNWPLILGDLRHFVLNRSNMALFINHPQGPACIRLFGRMFLRAVSESQDDSGRHEALEGLSDFLKATADKLKPEQLPAFGSAFSDLFHTISDFPQERLLLLSQCHQPVKSTVLILLRKARTMGEDQPFPVEPDA